MHYRTLGQEFAVSAIGLGCMGMSEFYGPHDDNESMIVLNKAVELGVTLFDTSDTYGNHHNEELLGKFLADQSADIKIATKFGIVRRPGEYQRSIDNSPAYIRQACEASLKRLGRETIDLYYVHRLDPDASVETTMETLSDLVREGKVAHIGLSEVNPETLRRAHAIHPVTAVQTEYSLWTRDVESAVLPTCRELGVGFVAYSPLGRGFLTGNFHRDSVFTSDDARGALPRFTKENLQANRPLADIVAQLAERKSCSLAQVSLAWLLAQGEDIVPIPGTRRIKHLEDNLAAADITVCPEDLADLNSALEHFTPAGERYTQEGMKGVNV